MPLHLQLCLSFAVVVALSGCQFDSSASLADESDQADAGGAGAQSCDAFEPQTCGDCGMQVCTDGVGGVLIDCVPRSDVDLCAIGQICDGDGACSTVGPSASCEPGETRACGDCGQESCIEGQWSGGCQANQDLCQPDLACLEAAPNQYACTLSCSTVGHREPCEGQGPIADEVALGTSWNSHNACLFDDGCRSCTCVIGLFGDPVVSCDLFCGSN